MNLPAERYVHGGSRYTKYGGVLDVGVEGRCRAVLLTVKSRSKRWQQGLRLQTFSVAQMRRRESRQKRPGREIWVTRQTKVSSDGRP